MKNWRVSDPRGPWPGGSLLYATIRNRSHEKTDGPRYLIQVIFYAVAPDSHYAIGQPAPANQLWILIGQGD